VDAPDAPDAVVSPRQKADQEEKSQLTFGHWDFFFYCRLYGKTVAITPKRQVFERNSLSVAVSEHLGIICKVDVDAADRGSVLVTCKAPEFLDSKLHKIHAASAISAWAARTWAGVA
jgi:hypothetical protein